MGDVNDDGIYDLVVGAGKDHAPEVVAYSGKAKDGKGPFETELARFEAFPSAARGGDHGGFFADRRIDGRQHHRRLGSRHSKRSQGLPREIAVQSTGTAPELFSTFSPYSDDRNGVNVASGFVDFSTGRYSIVTAPGPGSMAQVKVFNFPLMPPIDKSKATGAGADQCEPGDKKPVVTNAFMPFGLDYKGGLSLATGWLGGTLGGAERIVVGQLAGPGAVKVYSSGSALQGGPAMYLAPADHSPIVGFGEMASFTPFDGRSGVSVATTSTTTGANLLVSGVSPEDKTALVRKYELIRVDQDTTTLQAKQLSEFVAAKGSQPAVLGGD